MSSVMFPMFLPADFFIDKLVRCIIAISLFEAAYVAEVIRGGLQALPTRSIRCCKIFRNGILENAYICNFTSGFKT